MQKILGYVRKAVQEYSMINENDNIAVGVSGGKDSVVLLTALAKLREFYPVKFSVTAITVDSHFNGKDGDYSKIAELCERLDVPYHIEKTLLWDIVFKERKEENPCSLCSRMRKGALYNTATDKGCNKVALGHHLDDAAVTFYMSLFKNGTISCFSPVSQAREKGIEVIRPLVFTREREIIGAIRRENLPIIKSLCTENGCTARSDISKTVTELEKQYGDLKEKTVGAMKRAHICGW